MGRPLKFPTMATNQGLAIGAGAAQGINSAISNYFQRSRMQQQMQIQQQRAQMQMNNSNAMLELRKRQTEAMELHNQGSTMDRMMVINSGGRLNDSNKSVVKDMMNTRLEQTPEDQRPAVAASMQSQFSAGKTPSEVLQGMNMTPSEVTSYSKANAVQGANQRNANTVAGREYAADQSLKGVQYRTDNRPNGIKDQWSGEESHLQQMNAYYTKQYNMAAHPSPNQTGFTPPPDTDKMKDIADQQSQVGTRLNAIRGYRGLNPDGTPASSGKTAAPQSPTPSQATGTPGSMTGAQGGPPAPAAPTSPIKVTSPDQIPNQVGAKWINPAGTAMVTSKAPDGSIIHIPDPGAAAPAPAAPMPQAPPISPSAGIPAGQ